MSNLLEMKNLQVSFYTELGETQAVKDASFQKFSRDLHLFSQILLHIMAGGVKMNQSTIGKIELVCNKKIHRRKRE